MAIDYEVVFTCIHTEVFHESVMETVFLREHVTKRDLRGLAATTQVRCRCQEQKNVILQDFQDFFYFFLAFAQVCLFCHLIFFLLPRMVVLFFRFNDL